MFKFQRGTRFARSEAATVAAPAAAADSPRHRGSESPLSPELDCTEIAAWPPQTFESVILFSHRGLRKRIEWRATQSH